MLPGAASTDPRSGVFQRALVVTRYWPVAPINGAFKYTTQLVDALRSTFNVSVMGAEYGRRSASETATSLGTATSVWRLVCWLFQGMPAVTTHFSTMSNRRQLERLLSDLQPDCVVIDHLASTWALSTILRWSKKKTAPTKIVYVAHNVESKVRSSAARAFSANALKRIANRLDSGRCARAETIIPTVTSLVVCISDQDAREFRALGAAKVITFRPGFGSGPQVAGRMKIRRRQIAILGSFIWDIKRQNLEEFLTSCATAMESSGVGIKVVGWMEEPHLSRFRQRWPGVVFTGFVEDASAELDDSRIGLVIDDAGGGFKLKILDYIAAGLPVAGLSSALGEEVISGINTGVIAADSLSDLAARIAAIIDLPCVLEQHWEESNRHFSTLHSVQDAEVALTASVLSCCSPSLNG